MKQKQLLSIFLLVFVLGLLAACAPATTAVPAEQPTAAPEATAKPADTAVPEVTKVQVRWFVGLGAGSDVGTFEAQQAVVDAFNESQEEIELILEIVDNDQAYATLATQISGGNAPDIVGPVGIRGRDSFKGAWLDLEPLIEANDYDLSAFDPAMVQFYNIKGEGQLGIPFGIFPSYLFVNKDLFDEAGLPYPPQEYGAPYVDENGEEHVWDMNTLRELGMKLTVDANGNDATSDAFDPENIVQFGYIDQFTDMRGVLTMFGAGSLVADDGTAQVPEQWREGAKWVYEGMWTDHFYPTDAYQQSDVLRQGNPFQSGNVALAHVHTWFMAPWALGPDTIDFVWDTAAVPEYNGKVTAKMHADTFCITKGSKNPEAAFTVLTYLLSEEVVPGLIKIYGGMPARLALQDNYMENYVAETFPDLTVNTQVIMDSISYPDNPNHEDWIPSFQESSEAYTETWTKLAQEPGLDVDAELDALVEKLQTIFDAAEE